VHMSANLFEGGTGCHMWDAGFLLAEWLLHHPQLITGARSSSCLLPSVLCMPYVLLLPCDVMPLQAGPASSWAVGPGW
jgi:hypothetical protein